MTIDAFDVPRWVNWIFHRVMDTAGYEDRVHAEFVELWLEIFCRNRSTMTGKTILFFGGKSQQARPGSRVMGCVAILACISRNGSAGRMRPGIYTRAIPTLIRKMM